MDTQRDIWSKNWKQEAQIDPKQILEGRFARESFNCINKFIEHRTDNLILEAGCGTGRLSCLLAKENRKSIVTGIDIAQSSIQIASGIGKYLGLSNVKFQAGNLFNMPFPDNYFDVVFNEGVIEHFPLEEKLNYKEGLLEMIRVTKPKGKIIVAVPNWYCFPHTFYKWLLKKLSKNYTYGYEKSFKHSELKHLFSELNLQKLKFSAFYPSHCFYRLQRKGVRRFLYYLGKFVDYLQLIDHLTNDSFTKKFGFEILIKGTK